MKNKITLLTLIIAAILISSCGKEKGPDNNGDRVKSYTEEMSTSGGSFSMAFTLSYDGEKRITAITPVTAGEGKFVFTYPSKDKYTMALHNSGNIEIQQDFLLLNSLLDSTIQYNAFKDTMSEKYNYNAAKLLTSKFEYEHYLGPKLVNVTQYTYDAAGNMIRSSDRDGIVETFTYYADLIYSLPAIAPFSNFSGKTQLIKSHQSSHSGTLMESTVTTYTFDSKNRIETVKETTSDGTVMTKSFTYF